VSLLLALRSILESSDGGALLADADARAELCEWFPELEAGRGFEQPELHAFTVLDHNLATATSFDEILGEGGRGSSFALRTAWLETGSLLDGEVGGVPIVAATRLACLLHDIAKPATATFADGRLRFPRHGPRGAELMAERLPRVGSNAELTRFITSLIRYHLRPRELIQPWPPTDKAVSRFLRDLDGHMLPLLLVNLCDGMATQGPRYTDAHFDRHLNFLNYVMSRVAELDDRRGLKPLMTGHDLLTELGMEGGRLVGAVLTSVLAAQSSGELTSREEAIAHARKALAELEASSP
jgi:poly(A) polymerase/tRNA nucleotidyltransferase (CCA-adding enzyme)